jgi:multiple sugar transport system substrate-binding protein
VPVTALRKKSLQNTRPRPVSPYYSDTSLVMAEKFNASLRGDMPVGQIPKGLKRIANGAAEYR